MGEAAADRPTTAAGGLTAAEVAERTRDGLINGVDEGTSRTVRETSLPTIVVVDKNGKVMAVRSGVTDESSLESLALSAR